MSAFKKPRSDTEIGACLTPFAGAGRPAAQQVWFARGYAYRQPVLTLNPQPHPEEISHARLSTWRVGSLSVAVLGDVGVAVLYRTPCCPRSYAPWLLDLVREMPGRQIDLDCDEVQTFSSETLATLLLLQKTAKENGGHVRRLFNLGQ